MAEASAGNVGSSHLDDPQWRSYGIGSGGIDAAGRVASVSVPADPIENGR